MKKLRIALIILALVLSHAMCAVTAYGYCNMRWLGQTGETGAPAWVALLYALPFLAAIAVCVLAAHILSKRSA